MNKKSSIISLTVLVVAAILFGIVLVNKGDGPVMGMVLADKVLTGEEDYEAVVGSRDAGVYLVLSNEMNKLKEKYKAEIPVGKDIFASVYFVECPKGASFKGKWILDGNVVYEETGILQSDKKGIVPYRLEAGKFKNGKCVFELYDGEKKIFGCTFDIG
jgi:hypothetical protein